jgi:hypothetical protein
LALASRKVRVTRLQRRSRSGPFISAARTGIRRPRRSSLSNSREVYVLPGRLCEEISSAIGQRPRWTEAAARPRPHTAEVGGHAWRRNCRACRRGLWRLCGCSVGVIGWLILIVTEATDLLDPTRIY